MRDEPVITEMDRRFARRLCYETLSGDVLAQTAAIVAAYRERAVREAVAQERQRENRAYRQAQEPLQECREHLCRQIPQTREVRGLIARLGAALDRLAEKPEPRL